jgi:hypothetical protein
MKKTTVNLLAGLGCLFLISVKAHAGLLIQYSLDGGAKATLASGASGSTVSYTDFLVQNGGGTTIFKLTGSSNTDSPGDPSIAYLKSGQSDPWQGDPGGCAQAGSERSRSQGGKGSLGADEMICVSLVGRPIPHFCTLCNITRS